MDNQTFFSASLQHLRHQGESSLRVHGNIAADVFTLHGAYRDHPATDANTSAVGSQIPFESYTEAMESYSPSQLVKRFPVVARIFEGVDVALMVTMEVIQMRGRFDLEELAAKAARDFSLQYTAPVMRRIEILISEVLAQEVDRDKMLDGSDRLSDAGFSQLLWSGVLVRRHARRTIADETAAPHADCDVEQYPARGHWPARPADPEDSSG